MGQDPSTDLAASADLELKAILDFWLRNARDSAGEFRAGWRNGQPLRGARGPVLSSRILWTFSLAYQRLGQPALLAMAEAAYADMGAVFRDPTHGGFVWSVDQKAGRRFQVKQTYGQAFCIFGLSEYFRTSGHLPALEEAIALYRLIKTNAHDRERGGYFDTLKPDWKSVASNRSPGPKSQNTMLHLMEAYTSLLRVWPDDGLRADLVALIELFQARIVDPVSAHLQMFFSADMEPVTKTVSPGHDIEFSWLLTEAARAVGSPTIEAECRDLSLRVAAATLPAIEADGGIPNEIGPSGVVDAHRVWWVMAEAAVGFFNAFELSADPRYRIAAEGCWDYIRRHLIDREQGEWFARIGRDGRADRQESKIGFWKCPYHNGRACMEIVDRARRLGLSPAA